MAYKKSQKYSKHKHDMNSHTFSGKCIHINTKQFTPQRHNYTTHTHTHTHTHAHTQTHNTTHNVLLNTNLAAHDQNGLVNVLHTQTWM